MSTYAPSTIKRARTILANADREARMQRMIREAQAARPRVAAKPTPKPVAAPKPVERTRKAPESYAEFCQRVEGMRGKPASEGQMRRINRIYKADGLRVFEDIESFRLVFDMADAAIEYATITDKFPGQL